MHVIYCLHRLFLCHDIQYCYNSRWKQTSSLIYSAYWSTTTCGECATLNCVSVCFVLQALSQDHIVGGVQITVGGVTSVMGTCNYVAHEVRCTNLANYFFIRHAFTAFLSRSL